MSNGSMIIDNAIDNHRMSRLNLYMLHNHLCFAYVKTFKEKMMFLYVYIPLSYNACQCDTSEVRWVKKIVLTEGKWNITLFIISCYPQQSCIWNNNMTEDKANRKYEPLLNWELFHFQKAHKTTHFSWFKLSPTELHLEAVTNYFKS